MQANEKQIRHLRSAQLLTLALAAMAATLVGQNQPPPAGSIVTMVPVGTVTRPATQPGKMPATRGMALQWGDTVSTERGGRVRIRLEDGSILNVGSQSALLIQKHDAREQNTELDLLYGKLRSNATRIVRPGGQFKVKTRAATAGVVGTEKYVEASEFSTTVIALGGGNVVVSSSDNRFTQAVVLVPGETVTMAVGRPPGQKRAATPEELSKAVAETDSDPLVQLNPSSGAPGTQVEATITGRGLDNARGFSFAQSGIQVTRRGTGSATSVPVTITVGADVPPGAYTLTVDRPNGPATGAFVVLSRETPVGTSGYGVVLPPSSGAGGIRGAKITFDASNAQTPAGTQIVRYEWRVQNSQLTGNDSTFTVNTSLMKPGNYNVEVTVTNDRGQSATQRYPLTVQAGPQPSEILQSVGTAYESLQPSEFLRYFDEQKFRNFGGFAAAIEDSFRNQIESMRVFQRAVNCQVLEEQDQAVCQADFELQFTKKDQSTQLLDAQGNPVPPGATAPAGARLGKAVQTGFERNTLRFERADQGWKIVDYGAVVSCPGGGSTNGVSVGSCVLAAGSAATPTFQLINLQLSSSSLAIGGTVGGTVEIQSLAGYNGQVNLTGQAQVGNQAIAVQFASNPASPGTVVSFTVNGPASAPAGFTGATNFTLVITGQDTSGNPTATVNAPMSLQPDYTLSVSPATTSGAPLSVTHNSTRNLQVSVVAGPGFTGSVIVDFPNLPAGFQIAAGSVTAGSTGTFPLLVSPAASPGPALITVRSASSANVVRTSSVFAVVASDFTLTASSPTGFVAGPGGTMPIVVNVVPISGFAASVSVDFTGLSAGLTPVPPNAVLAAGASAPFNIGVAAGVPLGGVSFTVRGTFLSTVRTLPVSGNIQSANKAPDEQGAGQPSAPGQQSAQGTRGAGRQRSGAPGGPGTVPGQPTSGERPVDPLATNPLATTPPGGAGVAAPGGDRAARGAAGSSGGVRTERARIRVTPGACTGFRFASGGEQPCGGSADIELTASADGAITLEAEGVASVGSVTLEQYRPATAAAPALSRNAAVQTGVTYLVQSRNVQMLVRVTAGRTAGGGTGRTAGRRRDEGATGQADAAISVVVEWRPVPAT